MKRKIWDDVPGGITYRDLRILLFWASVGVATHKYGQYPQIEQTEGDPGVLKSYADHIRFQLPYPPKFGSLKRR